MSVDGKNLGRMVTLYYGDGTRNMTGQMVCYCSAPTVSVNLPDGQQVSWRADLCELATIEEVSEIAIIAIHKERNGTA